MTLLLFFSFFTEGVQAFNRLNRAAASLVKIGTKEILNSGEGKIPHRGEGKHSVKTPKREEDKLLLPLFPR